MSRWVYRRWLAMLGHLPEPVAIHRREILLGAIGVGLGLLLTELLSRWLLAGIVPWFVAPMGASAVLLFAIPASPLAQPWAVLGGNLVSALVGVACQHWLGDSGAVAALAGGLAVGAMFVLRCLHPPGGAMALTAVIGGPVVHGLGFGFALWPVAVNSLCILALAFLINNASGRRYPHQSAVHPHRTSDPLPSHRGGVSAEDMDAALASFGEVLDIDRDDLEELIARTHTHAMRRQWRGLRCGDVMSRDVVCLQGHESADSAWRLLARHKVKALPVVDAEGVLLGIVTLHDLYLLEAGRRSASSMRRRHDEPVSEFMTRNVLAVKPAQPMADLAHAFSDRGLHHLPVVDEANRVVGMITQSDVVATLFGMATQTLRSDSASS